MADTPLESKHNLFPDPESFITGTLAPQLAKVSANETAPFVAERILPQMHEKAKNLKAYEKGESTRNQAQQFLRERGIHMPDDLQHHHLTMNEHLFGDMPDFDINEEIHFLTALQNAFEFVIDDMIADADQMRDSNEIQKNIPTLLQHIGRYLHTYASGNNIEEEVSDQIPQEIQPFIVAAKDILNEFHFALEKIASNPDDPRVQDELREWRKNHADALDKHFRSAIGKNRKNVTSEQAFINERSEHDSGMFSANYLGYLLYDCFLTTKDYQFIAELNIEALSSKNLDKLRQLTNTIASITNDLFSIKELYNGSLSNAIPVIMQSRDVSLTEAYKIVASEYVEDLLSEYETVAQAIRSAIHEALDKNDPQQQRLVQKLNRYISTFDIAIQATYKWQIDITDRYKGIFQAFSELRHPHNETDPRAIEFFSQYLPAESAELHTLQQLFANAYAEF